MAALSWPTPKVWLVKINFALSSRFLRAIVFSSLLFFFWLFELREIYALCCFYGAAGTGRKRLAAAGRQRGGAGKRGSERFHCFAKLVGRCGQLNASPLCKRNSCSKSRASGAFLRLIELQLPLNVPS